MKKLFVITVLLFVVFLMAAHTVSAKPKFTTGPKAGINIMSYAGEYANKLPSVPDTDPGYIPGGYIGWMISADMNEYLTIRLEPGYAQRGGDWELTEQIDDTTHMNTNQYIRLEYFAIPLVAQVTLPEKKFRPFFCAGVSIAFNTGSSTQFESEVVTRGRNIAHFLKYWSEIYNPKKTIFEGMIGIGLETSWRSKKISLEGRYIFSFGKVFDDVENPDDLQEGDIAFLQGYLDGADLKHSVFSIMIGVSFPI
jgi:hypothetical protein